MQTLNYYLTIWESEIENNQKYLTPIIPFIFYHGKSKSNLKHNFKEYFEPNKALDKYLMDFKFVIFDTTQIENHDIIKSINNLYLSASLLLMKNIFKDIKEIKPILKEIVTLDDDKVIRLFEYIGEDTMPTLAQRWLEEGKAEGIQIGMQRGMFETAIIMMEKLNHSIDEIAKV